MYTCAGVQVSWNSRQILEAAPFMDKLPLCHWRVMMKIMRCAEYAFEAISNHQVISNVHHKVVSTVQDNENTFMR